MSYLLTYTNGGDTLSVSEAAGFSISTLPVSIAIWVRPTYASTPIAADGTALHLGANIASNNRSVRVVAGNKTSNYNSIARVTNSAGSTSSTTASTNTLTGDTWCLLVAVYTGSGTTVTNIASYVWRVGDAAGYGEKNTVGSLSRDVDWGGAQGPGNCVMIGTAMGTSGLLFDGYVAEAAIWGAALSDTDVQTLTTYYANSGVNSLPTPTAYWPLLSDATATLGTTALTVNGSASNQSGVHPTLSSGASAVAGISRHYARMMNG